MEMAASISQDVRSENSNLLDFFTLSSSSHAGGSHDSVTLPDSGPGDAQMMLQICQI